MLDESARRIVERLESEVREYERELREQYAFPLDSLPVSVQQIATYRNLYFHTLRQLIANTDELRRLLLLGGDEVMDVFCELPDKLPGSDGRRYPRSSHPRPDGDR